MSKADLPPGAIHVSNFLSNEEQAALAAVLDDGVWSTELKRRVQHFGYRYDYRARTVTDDAYLGPLPDWLARLADRLVREGYFDRLPDQVIANEYLPGQGISAHVDCVPCFAEWIASLSLLSACELVFRDVEHGERRSLILEPRSLLLLGAEARYGWTHEIPARASDVIEGERLSRQRRISLTFRTVIRT